MSKKFTGITSAGSAIPVYDKDAHSALEQKLDTSAFSSVSGEFATIDDVVAAVSGKADTSAIPSLDGYATEEWVEEQLSANVPQGVMQTSGLEYDGDKISGYMGSAFAGGGEVPEGVMVESAVGYNAVNEISGYNGSAIAQYGAEKQWLVHDDTLVHAANSAQYALGVNLSAVAQLLGVDETVLWSGSGITTAFELSEAASGFNKIRYEWKWNNSVGNATINSVFNPDTQIFNLYAMNSINTNKYYTIGNFTYDSAYKNITYVSGWQGANSVPDTATIVERFISIRKIVGIGRKQ